MTTRSGKRRSAGTKSASGDRLGDLAGQCFFDRFDRDTTFSETAEKTTSAFAACDDEQQGDEHETHLR